ncbi:MAG: Mur ligase family protein [Acidobacteriota bacterium]|nr:Mur ligase family protein [Acidobacteriota bacterium]
MNFQQSLDYLLSLGFERSVKKFGLENTTVLLDALGNPQNKFLKIQVAGTNGKGSTCAFLESICRSAGISAGLNTSPHLVSVTERIRLDGADISEKKFAQYATRVREVGERLVLEGALPGLPTFFEHITAMAQSIFADEGMEIAILEVGLGGRFDATTATLPEIVAFTPIDLDHTKTLGGTIAEIAAEKAAIIRSDTRVFSVPQNKEAEAVIDCKCRQHGVEPDWVVPGVSEVDDGITRFETETRGYNVKLDIPGRHQWTNAALAISIAEALSDWNINISKDDTAAGLERARHPGRLEYGDGILYDGAHNVAGAVALREYLLGNVKKPITMIYGTSSGKSVEEIAKILFPIAENLILTTSENPRAVNASEFAGEAAKYIAVEKRHVVEGVGNALELGKELAGDNVLLVTGSLYLIGEVKAYLKDRAVERRKKKPMTDN